MSISICAIYHIPSIDSASYNFEFLPNFRLAESVRLVMALSMFISFALQFYVPIEIMWPSMKSRIPTEKMQKISEYAFRTILVIITCECI